MLLHVAVYVDQCKQIWQSVGDKYNDKASKTIDVCYWLTNFTVASLICKAKNILRFPSLFLVRYR